LFRVAVSGELNAEVSMASFGFNCQIVYGSAPDIVVMIIGGFGGMLIFASPEGLWIQWNSIHTHFLD